MALRQLARFLPSSPPRWSPPRQGGMPLTAAAVVMLLGTLLFELQIVRLVENGATGP